MKPDETKKTKKKLTKYAKFDHSRGAGRAVAVN
jgi:hypothetical protein